MPSGPIQKTMTTNAQNESTAANPSATTLSSPWRVVISALLVFHLAAVLAGPWAFAPLHSQLSDSVFKALQPYVEIMGLNNGYRFFAPEPGPSHLIRYDAELADGSTRTATIPDLASEWPRLLYHRHFMLSEFLNSLDNPGVPKEMSEAYAESYARHVASTLHAKRVTLTMRRHRLPSMQEVRGGMLLTDPVVV